jgi:hypothetical protein
MSTAANTRYISPTEAAKALGMSTSEYRRKSQPIQIRKFRL